MQPPKATDDYSHGQMMGMLVIIQMLENYRDSQRKMPGYILENIKQIAALDLAAYLQKPEEDIMLLVDQQLRNI